MDEFEFEEDDQVQVATAADLQRATVEESRALELRAQQQSELPDAQQQLEYKVIEARMKASRREAKKKRKREKKLAGEEDDSGADIDDDDDDDMGAIPAKDDEEDADEEKEDDQPRSKVELRRKLIMKRRKAIYKKLSREERERYTKFNQASFTAQHPAKGNFKRIITNMLGTTKVSDQLMTVMGGIAKVFAGDIVEQSLVVKNEWGEVGPIRPVHMREAYRRLKSQGLVPSAQPKRLFRL